MLIALCVKKTKKFKFIFPYSSPFPRCKYQAPPHGSFLWVLIPLPTYCKEPSPYIPFSKYMSPFSLCASSLLSIIHMPPPLLHFPLCISPPLFGLPFLSLKTTGRVGILKKYSKRNHSAPSILSAVIVSIYASGPCRKGSRVPLPKVVAQSASIG